MAECGLHVSLGTNGAWWDFVTRGVTHDASAPHVYEIGTQAVLANDRIAVRKSETAIAVMARTEQPSGCARPETLFHD